MGLHYPRGKQCGTWASPGFATPAQNAGGSCANRVFVQLCIVHQMHLFPDQESLHSVSQALVISCLDYCNVLYMELPLNRIQKLPLRQNQRYKQFLELLKEPMLYHCSVSCTGCQFVSWSSSRYWFLPLKPFMA